MDTVVEDSLGDSILFVIRASTETLNGTIVCVTCFRGETKVTPKIVPFGKNNITMKCHYTN